ncbi:MAG: guanylate kinase [Desulfotomaculaceae bacterium]|nr:guanylate kinase [Desulfotomaculaceae bacterium]
MGEKGLLLVISGPSGTGKGTVVRALQRANSSLRLSISATTRLPRDGEVDGVDYYFMERDIFKKMIEEGQLLEWAKVYGNYYGTPSHFVRDALERGNDIILEIDIQGALQVKEKLPEAVLVFIAPPSKTELQTRLLGRKSDSREEIEKRLKCMTGEMKLAGGYDYIVVNDSINRALDNIHAIIMAEKCRTWRQQSIIEQLSQPGS